MRTLTLVCCLILCGCGHQGQQQIVFNRQMLQDYAQAHHLNWKISRDADGWICAQVSGTDNQTGKWFTEAGCRRDEHAAIERLFYKLSPSYKEELILAHGEAK